MKDGAVLKERYQLLEQIGSGGMAVVYRARDLELARYVAIKVLREDYSRQPAFQEQFRQEARAAANLSHPNIVTVHDFGFDLGQLFLVMELVPGTDLKTLIARRGRFMVAEALPLMTQACAGVGYAHRAGLVHCDVKPHNMLVMPDGRLKVTDFGIARALATIHTDERSEVVWGSPQYFAPEQSAGQAPLPSSDVYSLGVVLYEMLTGTPPFQAADPDELARLHQEVAPVPLREYLPDIPRDLEQVVHKVLSKEPAQRYRTADQLGHVLRSFIGTPSAPALTLTPEAPQAFRSAPAPAQRPAPAPVAATTPSPAPATASSRPIYREPARERPAAPPAEIDWFTVALGLLALIATGGLIPFWMYVYFVYNPPLR